MQPFITHQGIVAPLNLANIDTDMIIPKQFLTTIERSGLGKGLFYEMRFRVDGTRVDDFMLHRAPYESASILVAGENFGCGSSREHAPWALLDFGFRCVIAPSFADIFYNNCFKNGILPVTLPAAEVQEVMAYAAQTALPEITVDLPAQTLTLSDGRAFSFTLDPFRKDCLLHGWDDIGLTLRHEPDVTAYEARQQKVTPWLSVG